MRQVTGGRLRLVVTLAVEVGLGDEHEPVATDDVEVAAERAAAEMVAELKRHPRPLNLLCAGRFVPGGEQRVVSVEQWEVVEAHGQTVTPADLRWAAAEDAHEDNRKGLS